MINVYMDDYRKPPQGFTLARTTEECLLYEILYPAMPEGTRLHESPLSSDKLREIAAGAHRK